MLCPILIGSLFYEGFYTKDGLDFPLAHGHRSVRPTRLGLSGLVFCFYPLHHVRWETLFGELAEMLFPWSQTWSEDVWLQTPCALIGPTNMKTLSMLYGLVRFLHKHRMVNHNGILENRPALKVFHISSLMFLNLGAMLNFLQWWLGQSGSGVTKFALHHQVSQSTKCSSVQLIPYWNFGLLSQGSNQHQLDHCQNGLCLLGILIR